MKLSVLVTYHNEGAMLGECLASLAAQSRPVDEILVYDDASTVPPQGFIPPGLPVRVLRGAANVGPAAGRNILLSEATGELVHFHDADDWFHPAWSERVLAAFAGCDGACVFNEVASTRAGAPSYERAIVGLRELAADPDLVRFCLGHALLVPCGTYRAALVRECGGYDTQWRQSEDFDFHLRLALRRPAFAVIEEPLCCIRRHHRNRSALEEPRVWQDALRIVEHHGSALLPSYAAEAAEAACRFAARLFQLREFEAARHAYACALRWEKPRYAGRRQAFRALARLLGPYRAEQLAALLRVRPTSSGGFRA